MTTFKANIIAIVAALFAATVFLPASLEAQATTTQTTISLAQGATDTTVTLTSATGVSVKTLSVQTGIMVGMGAEAEYEEIGQLVSGTTYTVSRGSNGSRKSPHVALEVVWLGPPNYFSNSPYDPGGTCVSTTQTNLPRPNIRTGKLAFCTAGKWATGPDTPTIGSNYTGAGSYTSWPTFVPPTAITNSSVTDVAGKIWFSQLFIPVNSTLTGACLLNGATVATDKWIFALYDSSGVLLANTAVAGVTTATASKYQCIAFTATLKVPGHNTYFIAVQGNGTTDNFQAYATAGAPTNYGVGSQTGTFGTLAAITPSNTFAAATGPVMLVY